MTDPTADRLRMAADRLRTNFGRFRLCDANGNACAVGAILDVRRGDADPESLAEFDVAGDRALTVFRDYLVDQATAGDEGLRDLKAYAETSMFRIDVITHWNDRIVTDGVAASDLMEKAAADWESRS